MTDRPDSTSENSVNAKFTRIPPTRFAHGCIGARGPVLSRIVDPMTSGGFLSTASVVVALACVAVLAVASALALAPLDGSAQPRRGVRGLPRCSRGFGDPRRRADQAHHHIKAAQGFARTAALLTAQYRQRGDSLHRTGAMPNFREHYF